MDTYAKPEYQVTEDDRSWAADLADAAPDLTEDQRGQFAAIAAGTAFTKARLTVSGPGWVWAKKDGWTALPRMRAFAAAVNAQATTPWRWQPTGAACRPARGG